MHAPLNLDFPTTRSPRPVFAYPRCVSRASPALYTGRSVAPRCDEGWRIVTGPRKMGKIVRRGSSRVRRRNRSIRYYRYFRQTGARFSSGPGVPAMTTRAAGLLGLVLLGIFAHAESPKSEPPAATPPVLTVEAAVHYALENNPALAAERQQHGIAAAKVVIADTYPFNPVLENRIQAAGGPPAADVVNNVPVEHVLLWEVEVRGQRRYRRQAAAA